MNREQKEFIALSVVSFLIISALALLVKAGGDLYLQSSFFHLFARHDLSGAILAVIIMSAAILRLRKFTPSTVDNIIDKIRDHPRKIAVTAFATLSAGAFFVYHNHPLSMDEYMPSFQAKVFAEGELWGQFPPELVPWLLIPECFSVYSVETGRVVSSYWPGFALLLTPFMKIGAPWLLNPLLGASTLLLLSYYTQKILPNTQAAGWVMLLTLASPAFTINAISYYSMNAHLFMNLLYAVLLLECSPLRLFAAGIVGSIALVLHNPVPHLLFAIPWIIWIAMKPGRMQNLGYLMLGYLPLTLILGFGWFRVQRMVAEGIPAAKVSANSLEIVSNMNPIQRIMAAATEIWDHAIIKPFMIIRNLFKFPDNELLYWRVIGLSKLFVWAVPGLPILTLLGIKYIKKNNHLKLWGWSALCTWTGYMFIPFSQGHGWGFRYFHSVWPVLPLFAALFLVSVAPNRDDWKRLIGITAVLCIVLGTGLRCFQVHQFIDQHLAQRPPLKKGENQICFLNTWSSGYYIRDLLQNDPFLRDSIIFFRSLGYKRDKNLLKEYFPTAQKTADKGLSSVWLIGNTDKKNE